MATDAKAWAHLGALGAYLPLSVARTRACNDCCELAPDPPNSRVFGGRQQVTPAISLGVSFLCPALTQT